MLIGNPIIPIPNHPKIHHLGFVSDQDKFDALAAAELLIMPSYFESLSMVALEAWALGKPVLANGRCDVLKGQCIRSNGGLYYDNFLEFVETLRAIDFRPDAGERARHATAATTSTRHYTWPIIERKYLDMLERLAARAAGVTDRERCRGGSHGAVKTCRRPTRSSRKLPTGPVAGRRVAGRPRRAAGRAIATPAPDSRAGIERRAEPSTEARRRRRSASGPGRNGDRRRPPGTPARSSAARAAGRRGARGGQVSMPVRRRSGPGRPPFTRCWPRSATATPSATRCSASSACCGRPATSRRSSSRPPIPGSKI